MSDNSLSEKGIVITRPRTQADGLARRVEAHGGRALLYPAIEITDPGDPDGARRAIEALPQTHLAIFVSPTAVTRGMHLVRQGAGWPASVPVAGIGGGTRRELEREGHLAVLSPVSGADSEALLAMPELRGVTGKRIIIFRGEGGSEALGETLSARGADVIFVQCYRRTRPDTDLSPLVAGWEGVDAVTVFSSETLENLITMLGDAGAARLRQTPVFVPHRRIADDAIRRGLRTVKISGPGDDEMVAGLVAYFRDAK